MAINVVRTGVGGTVQTGELDDDAVTLAKMAHAADSGVLIYDATGVPTALGAGTVTDVLTSSGTGAAPVWAAAGAPAGHSLDSVSHTDVTAITEAQGQIFYYDGTNWNALAVGTAGNVLKTQGADANPAWTDTAPKSNDLSIGSQAQGDVLYFNGTNWARLEAGTSGNFLKTQGAEANPIWAAVAGADNIDNLSRTSISDFDTSSTEYVDITTATKTITTGENRVLVIFTTTTSNTAIAINWFLLNIDGNGKHVLRQKITAVSDLEAVCIAYLSDVLSADSHTFKIQMKVSTGTGSAVGSLSSANLSIIEVID